MSDDLRGIDPTLAKLARQLRKEGWTITRTRKGNIVWKAPGGGTANTLAKPVGRTMRNSLMAIQRAKAVRQTEATDEKKDLR